LWFCLGDEHADFARADINSCQLACRQFRSSANN
jgi:hypothetical protein